jgi:hypothetical protein
MISYSLVYEYDVSEETSAPSLELFEKCNLDTSTRTSVLPYVIFLLDMSSNYFGNTFKAIQFPLNNDIEYNNYLYHENIILYARRSHGLYLS